MTIEVEPSHPGLEAAARRKDWKAVGDLLAQNVAASLVLLSLAFLSARRLSRFLKEILK